MRYLIQYVAGAGDLILDALPSYVENIEVRYRDDSAMVFDSNSRVDRVASIPFAKNAFVVIATTPRGSIDKGVNHLSCVLQTQRFPALPSGTRNFRTMIHIDGELHSVDKGAKSALEQAIATRTGGRVEPRGMCREFWVVGRLDLPDLLFCARLPKARRPPKAKGAVSYELSSMLVSASRPDPRDVFLDPFAGSGSFVLARQDMPARRIWYSDTNGSLRTDLPREMTNDRRVRFLKEDALTLPTIPDGSIDVIVTDPPWGEFEDVGMPYRVFARGIAESFDRVLDQLRGKFVLLSARRMAETLVGSLKDVGFDVTATHEILMNGHPATVIIGRRCKDTA
jgi:hypothetical protein